MISDDVKAENVLLQFDGDCNKPSPIAVDKTTAETPIVVDKTTAESTAEKNSIHPVSSAMHEKITPRKRFNASICCLGSHLYLWGGMWEEKDRRFTLDDIWTLDMVKLKEWKPLLESTETGLRWEGSDDEWEDEEGSSQQSFPYPSPGLMFSPRVVLSVPIWVYSRRTD